MTRHYGRAIGGGRCYDSSPCGHWKNITILSSIRLDGTTESVVFDGSLNRAMFNEYIKKILSPSLRSGDIVIMDNLSTHKSEVAFDAIKEKYADVLFLPAYSPDLNPIEKMWSKVKQILRGIKARSYPELFDGIKKALSLVSKNDAQGWFTACGYTI